jgi:hypothetical protein
VKLAGNFKSGFPSKHTHKYHKHDSRHTIALPCDSGSLHTPGWGLSAYANAHPHSRSHSSTPRAHSVCARTRVLPGCAALGHSSSCRCQPPSSAVQLTPNMPDPLPNAHGLRLAPRMRACPPARAARTMPACPRRSTCPHVPHTRDPLAWRSCVQAREISRDQLVTEVFSMITSG